VKNNSGRALKSRNFSRNLRRISFLSEKMNTLYSSIPYILMVHVSLFPGAGCWKVNFVSTTPDIYLLNPDRCNSCYSNYNALQCLGFSIFTPNKMGNFL